MWVPEVTEQLSIAVTKFYVQIYLFSETYEGVEGGKIKI